jgi:hypothetical protein
VINLLVIITCAFSCHRDTPLNVKLADDGMILLASTVHLASVRRCDNEHASQRHAVHTCTCTRMLSYTTGNCTCTCTQSRPSSPAKLPGIMLCMTRLCWCESPPTTASSLPLSSRQALSAVSPLRHSAVPCCTYTSVNSSSSTSNSNSKTLQVSKTSSSSVTGDANANMQ